MSDGRKVGRLRSWLRWGAVFGILKTLGLGVLLVWQTVAQLLPTPQALPPRSVEELQFIDRSGVPLSLTYQNRWNVYQRVAYHDTPEFLRQAFIEAEDRRFFSHPGVDWLARFHAVVQNVRARRAVRGASTISEQVARIIHPRRRTVWSRWLEGFEASRLEARFSKTELLEFYMNQVPYARNRRGVLQASRTYFDRDLDTLNPKEMMALVVLVRSPSRLDLIKGTEEIVAPLLRLAERMHHRGWLSDQDYQAVRHDPLLVVRPSPPVEATHFVQFARSRMAGGATPFGEAVRTTLDATLQGRVQTLLDRRVESLARRQVGDGAALVVDHLSGEILAWVNAGGFSGAEGSQIDMVRTPRQPGSTLKPFVYALALERGLTPATLIEDAPLVDAVGHGLHAYRNYSRRFYGSLRLREALGNSLNTPAVRALRLAGRRACLERLRRAGFATLTRSPEFYGDGLALGTGEVSLFALVRAYAALARGGDLQPLRWSVDPIDETSPESRRLFDPEVSSLIANILADPESRSREFGRQSLLNLPVETAIKTGTSNDYRDAWTLGFSYRYTVGVWMGNLDRSPMLEVSGSQGAALLVRSIFAELHRHDDSRPLYLSRKLKQQTICQKSGARPSPTCPTKSEWFRSGNRPTAICPIHSSEEPPPTQSRGVIRLESPTEDLHLAMDPRIPDRLERFQFKLEGQPEARRIEWIVDGRLEATNEGGATYLWPLRRGRHQVTVRALDEEGRWIETRPVSFTVK